ncbi:M1 family metallopeptidase [Nocardia sp. CDC159]|uniref:Aminopeptidase N n=1 Tax=Nocardia pulmonis TaxID=2951408 RepID=A0A9X2EI20_9NOCA|nr:MULTISPECIES: M1 family metallopeptidase [Nocardia]MCM6779043.1 M1 family metallopeptidase [Nocardia pulmonis]MCM6791933.1 M1 family metallopeptidase [Nocardia sp. CDC159]
MNAIHRGAARITALAVVGLVAPLLVAGPGANAKGPLTGIGDPVFPNIGSPLYDVSNYSIDLKYEPSSGRLSGTTTVTAKAKKDLQAGSAIGFDFLLQTQSVLIENKPAKYALGNDKLAVTMPLNLKTGDQFTAVVAYNDIPSRVANAAGARNFVENANGALISSEPFSAEWWYPSNDHPTDKATYAVSVLAPADMDVLSNGVETSVTQNIPGWKRHNWLSKSPQITYASYLAIGKYERGGQNSGSPNRPNITAYAKDLDPTVRANAKSSIERTPEITDWLASVLTPYPFESTGGVVDAKMGGYALETQTIPTYTDGFFKRGKNDSVVVHEMAHQWFGDSTSVATWKDGWLNEGFASYMEYLWSEKNGTGTAAEIADYGYETSTRIDWNVVLTDPGPAKVLPAELYSRGAMAIQAFRSALGDDDMFFRVLREWLTKTKFSNGKVSDFIDTANAVTGRSTNLLFKTWLTDKGKPAYRPSEATFDGSRSPAPRTMAPTAKPKVWDDLYAVATKRQ